MVRSRRRGHSSQPESPVQDSKLWKWFLKYHFMVDELDSVALKVTQEYEEDKQEVTV